MSNGAEEPNAANNVPDAYAGFNSGDIIKRMLSNLQAEWDSQPFQGTRGVDFHIHYQHGDFHVLTTDDRHLVHVHFLFFHEAPLGQLDNVRAACNNFNQAHPDFKVVYSVDAERHHIHLHVLTSFRLTLWNPVLESDFAETLSLCFECARRCRRILDEILDEDVNNLEEKRAFLQRETYLAKETEMKLEAGDWRVYDTRRLTLGDALYMILDTDDVRPQRLSVINDEMHVEETPSAILKLDLTALLADANEDGESPYFVWQQATLILEAAPYGKEVQTFILHLAAESEAEGVLYMRLTFVHPDRPLGLDNAYGNREKENASLSFLISFSKVEEHERQAEFDYIWEEALMRRNANKELTDEQRFVTMCDVPEAAYNLYWGYRFYLAKRYYEAILHLENAYYVLRDGYGNLTKEQRNHFFELSFYIGQCCLQLHMPRRAYYYLDGLFNCNNLKYTQGYINALVASHDYRAMDIVDNVLANLQRVYNEQEADEAHKQQLYAFLLFLRRTKVRLLIRAERLEEAEKLLNDLRQDDADHEVFILKQLTIIAELRIKKALKDPHSSLSVSSEFPKPETKREL